MTRQKITFDNRTNINNYQVSKDLLITCKVSCRTVSLAGFFFAIRISPDYKFAEFRLQLTSGLSLYNLICRVRRIRTLILFGSIPIFLHAFIINYLWIFIFMSLKDHKSHGSVATDKWGHIKDNQRPSWLFFRPKNLFISSVF